MAASRSYLLVVLPLLLAACGGGGSSSKRGGDLPAAVQKTLAQGSEKVAVSGKVDLSGQTISLDGAGAFGRRGGELHLNVELPVLGKTTVDELVVGKRAWLRSPLLGKRWLPLASNPKALGFDARALTGVTPATALELLRSGSATAVSSNHYRVTLGQANGGVRFNSAEAWVDDQNLVWRVKLDFDAKLSGSDKAHTVLTIDYSDFGTAVDVAPPAASASG
jgi:hypothetical protein